MRIVLALVAALAIGGGVVAHKHRTTTPVVAQTAAKVSAPSPTLSQHNWPKRSLDRAHDVKRQVLKQRKADGTE